MGQEKKIYALLVGINKFKNFTDLSGCINDANAMHSYLKGLDGFELDCKILTTDQDIEHCPTKNKIVDTFLEHLGKAQEGDVALFYFAGHGVQEATDLLAAQTYESQNLIESLVCYDSQKNIGDPNETSFLSDKEIRWMTKKLEINNPHILIITDCCHSGTITRENGKIRRGDEKPTNRSLGTPRRANMNWFAKRYYQQFEFSNEIPEEKFAKHSINELLPAAQYVHISACRDNQVAWEDKYENGFSGGLFTIKLLEFLNNSGPNLSYEDLGEQLSNYMKGRKVKQQNPQLHNYLPSEKGFVTTFLNGIAQPKKVQIPMKYNKYHGWVIGFGAIHGLKKNDQDILVNIYEEDLSIPPLKGRIYAIKPSYSVVELIDEYDELNEKKRYFAGVAAHIQHPIKFFLKGDDLIRAREILTQKLDEDPLKYISLVDSQPDSDYTIDINDKNIIITASDDLASKPVIKQIGRTGGKKAEFNALYGYLTQIGKWEFIKNLYNSDTKLNVDGLQTLDQYPIELKFYLEGEDGKYHEAKIIDEKITVPLTHIDDEGTKYRGIKIKLINHSDQDLFVSLLYMSMLYGSNPSAFESGSCLKAKDGETKDCKYAFEGSDLELSHDAYIKDFNWEGSTDILKLIVSTEEFSTLPFELDELEPPEKKEDNTKGSLKIIKPGDKIPKDDWMAVNYELFIPNPYTTGHGVQTNNQNCHSGKNI